MGVCVGHAPFGPLNIIGEAYVSAAIFYAAVKAVGPSPRDCSSTKL